MIVLLYPAYVSPLPERATGVQSATCSLRDPERNRTLSRSDSSLLNLPRRVEPGTPSCSEFSMLGLFLGQSHFSPAGVASHSGLQLGQHPGPLALNPVLLCSGSTLGVSTRCLVLLLWVQKAQLRASWEPQIHQIIPQRSPFIHLLCHLLRASRHALRMQQRPGQCVRGEDVRQAA